MTHARIERPDRTNPLAGTWPGALRETCAHRLGGFVRLSGTGIGFVGLETIGKSNERGRTGM